MNPLILTLSHFFHLLATVIWIGGIILILLVILPSAKVALESAPGRGFFRREFFLWFPWSEPGYDRYTNGYHKNSGTYRNMTAIKSEGFGR